MVGTLSPSFFGINAAMNEVGDGLLPLLPTSALLLPPDACGVAHCDLARANASRSRISQSDWSLTSSSSIVMVDKPPSAFDPHCCCWRLRRCSSCALHGRPSPPPRPLPSREAAEPQSHPIFSLFENWRWKSHCGTANASDQTLQNLQQRIETGERGKGRGEPTSSNAFDLSDGDLLCPGMGGISDAIELCL